MPTFTLKARDTRPILEVPLLNPDGSPHDLTGAETYQLHIYLGGDTVFTRDLTVEGLPTAGVLRYTWVAADWVDPDGLPIDGLQIPTVQDIWLSMDYEVVGGASRLTFPNGGTDTLRLVADRSS